MYALRVKIDNIIATTMTTAHLVFYDTNKHDETNFVFRGTAAYTEYTSLHDLR